MTCLNQHSLNLKPNLSNDESYSILNKGLKYRYIQIIAPLTITIVSKSGKSSAQNHMHPANAPHREIIPKISAYRVNCFGRVSEQTTRLTDILLFQRIDLAQMNIHTLQLRSLTHILKVQEFLYTPKKLQFKAKIILFYIKTVSSDIPPHPLII